MIEILPKLSHLIPHQSKCIVHTHLLNKKIRNISRRLFAANSIPFCTVTRHNAGYHYQQGTRHLSIYHRNSLQLENNVTHEVWDNNFWVRRKELYSSNRYRIELNRLFDKKCWFRKNLIDYRQVYFVLVDKKSVFEHIENVDDLRARFDDPDILATTHVTAYQLHPVVIPYRYLTTKEWDTILADLLAEHSPSMVYTGIMEFILLRSSSEIKIDKSIDVRENIDSQLVSSFLDYILQDSTADNAQRALMNYLNISHRFGRSDLVETAYGRVREKTKVFSPHFMLHSLELLQDTSYREDIYHFCDVLYHWFNIEFKRLLPACAKVALRQKDYETAFKWMGNVLSPDDRGFKEPYIDSFIVNMLDEFGYSEDTVRWKNNRTIVEGFLSTMASTRVFPGREGAIAIENWFKSIKNESWISGHYPFRNVRSYTCPLSGVHLKKKELSDEEYQYLAKVVMREILLSSNQIDEKGRVISLGFATADKREVKSFLSMLYDGGPFDLVVDGMNVYYHIIGHTSKAKSDQSGSMCAAWLRHVVAVREKRLGRKMKVLIVFRGHLRREIDNLLDDVATIWYTSDDTSDDLFFLYAAILCGKQCKLLTLDLLRDFRSHVVSRFDLLTVGLVFKWQQLHQDLVLLKTSKNLSPQKFDVSIHRSENTWHIPYVENHAPPQNWLMLKNLRS